MCAKVDFGNVIRVAIRLMLLLVVACQGTIQAPTEALCPTRIPSTSVTSLVPFQAITRDKVRFPLDLIQSGDFIEPVNPDHTLLLVFFEGIRPSTVISVRDLNWLFIDDQCERFRAIGFGFPTKQFPTELMGKLNSGSFTLEPEIGAADPLLSLVYIVPMETTTVTLWDPQGKEYILGVSETWIPVPKHYVSSLIGQEEGVLTEPLDRSRWKYATNP